MTIERRTSVIGTVKVDASSNGSVAQFGDSREVRLTDRAIAVQRRIPDYEGDETRFASYPIFSLPLPRMPEQPDDAIASRSRGNAIQVGTVRLLSMSASSYLHAGCTDRLTAQSRIKHIRQFNDAAGQPPLDENPI